MMQYLESVLLAVIIIALLVWVLSSGARSLDRLHKRIIATKIVLQAELVRKASVAAELANSGLLDPATSLVLAEVARAQVAADPDPLLRTAEESTLSGALRAALGEEADVAELSKSDLGETLANELADVWYRAVLARRFHNDAVSQCLRVRSRRSVRWFHLAGRMELPRTVEFDDAWPQSLTQPGELK